MNYTDTIIWHPSHLTSSLEILYFDNDATTFDVSEMKNSDLFDKIKDQLEGIYGKVTREKIQHDGTDYSDLLIWKI